MPSRVTAALNLKEDETTAGVLFCGGERYGGFARVIWLWGEEESVLEGRRGFNQLVPLKAYALGE